jgi:hypothetical protein
MAQEVWTPMHPQCSSGGAGAPPSRRDRDPQEIYETDQRALLDLLLGEFPGVLTYREALTAQVEDPEGLGEADRFASAARGLAAAGLVVRQGELVIPSRAARSMVDLGWILG